MQSNKIVGYFIACTTLAGFFSCKKSIVTTPTDIVGHAYTDTALVNAYYFKPGTYWIYADSVTGQIDSYAVTYAANKFYRDYIYGMHESHYDSASYYASYISSVNIDGTSTEQRKCKLVLDKYGINFYYYTHDYSEEPFYLQPHLLFRWPDTFSYTTYGTTYNNLALAENGYGSTYLLSQHMGMIKMNLPDQNHTWELVRCHIEQ